MSSEHTLRLKAVLDTTEVQNKLNSIQQRARRGGGMAPVADGVSRTMSMLNSSIQRLQLSIDRLTAVQKMENIANGSIVNGGQGLFSAALLGGLRKTAGQGGGITPPMTKKEFAADVSKRISGLPLETSRNVLSQIFQSQAAYREYLRGHREVALRETAGKIGRQYNWSSRLDALKNQPTRGAFFGGQIGNSGLNAGLMKQGAAFVGGTILNSTADILETRNDGQRTTGSRALRTGSSMLTGAAVGGMLGGVPGAAIGAAVGGLVGVLNDFKETTRQTAEAMANLKEEFFKAQALDKNVNSFFQDQSDKKALENKNLSYFEDELAKSEKMREKVTKTLDESGIGFTGKGKFDIREYSRETERIAKEKGSDSKEVTDRRNSLKLFEANFQLLKEETARAEKLKTTIAALKDEKETKNNPQQEAKKSGQQWSEAGKRAYLQFDSYLEPLQERLSQMKAPGMENVNSLASQGYMISQSDDEARLQMQIDYIRELVTITRDIKNIEKQKEGAVYL